MLSRVNSMVWMDNKEDEETSTWPQNNNNNGVAANNNNNILEDKDEMEMGSLSTFKSILEVAGDDQDWYNNNSNNNGGVAANNNGSNNMQVQDMRDISFSPSFTHEADHHHHNNLQLLQAAVDSSASCSPSPASVFNSLDPSQVQFFLPPKTTMPMLLNAMSNNNPLETSFDLGCDGGFLETQTLNAFGRGNNVFNGGFNDLTTQTNMNASNFSSSHQFAATNLLPLPQNSCAFGAFGYGGVGGNENSLFLNRSKILKPLDNFTSIGAQPTLFQKRAALRKNLANNGGNLGALGGEIGRVSNSVEGFEKNREIIEANEKKRKSSSGDDFEDVSIDGSNLNYDSDDFLENNCGVNNKAEESGKNGGNSSNANSTVTGADPKGKKKGLPAKNLMAERRRRKKLNDRLYMLRSVVPKISKMDRASILGDAIEYLKELLQKINDLHNELESTPPSSSLTPTTSFYPLTPTAPALSSRIKEELCPGAFASPLSSPTGQPARVEVRVREGRAVNIHMFCNRKPGILLSTMRALDNLGLDIQQAVISCFNGFALDIFRAEQCKDGQDVHPEHIKAILLESAGYHGMV